MEKRRKRSKEYFIDLLSVIIDTCGMVAKTSDIYTAIEMVDEKHSIKHTAVDNSKVCNRLCEMLGDSIKSTSDKKAKVVGRQKPMIYTLSGSKDDLLKKLSPSKEVTKKEKKEPRKVSPSEVGMQQVYYIAALVDSTSGPVSFPDIKERCGVQLSIQRLSELSESFKRHTGIDLNYKVGDAPYHKGKNGKALAVNIVNAKSICMILEMKFHTWFGHDPKPLSGIPVKKLIPRPAKKVASVSAPLVENKDLTDDEKYILYHLAGLCYKNHGPIDKATIWKYISDVLRMQISDYMALIKRSSVFSIVRTDQERISLVPGSWEKIKEEYNPENQKMCIMARISMSTESVAKYVGKENVVLLSPIATDEGIYQITLSRARKSLYNLLSLYRTFRGNDTILGNPGIVEALEDLEKVSAAVVRRNDDLYFSEEKL